jgi:Tol biopolymer transport system component
MRYYFQLDQNFNEWGFNLKNILRKIYEFKSQSKILLLFKFVFIFSIVVVNSACVMFDNDPVYGDPSFSPDGKTLVFRERNVKGKAGLGFLDIETNVHTFMEAPENSRLSYPSFSPDGKHIVASKSYGPYQSQIVVLDANGREEVELTEGKGSRTTPSFSPDGNKILFVFSPLPETGSTKKNVDQDIFEIDLVSGDIRQLTDFQFYHLLYPQYFPDGERFIFSGQGPRKPIGYREYDQKFGSNYIFIMSLEHQELVPVVQGYPYSTKPSISRRGDIVFIAVTNRIDNARGSWNYDFFSLSGGQEIRLTDLKSSILTYSISPDGKRIVFLANDHPKRRGNYEMFIMNSDGTGLRSLGLSGRPN